MAKTEQEIGQERVTEVFIQPLDRLGLGRPKGTPVAAFEGMKRELCARLWRLDQAGLEELGEWVLQHSETKANRWPPAALILAEAKPLLPPPWPPSDRMVAIFNHKIGRTAIANGWAPELFRRFVGAPHFPNDYSASQAFDQASPALARMKEIARRMDDGNEVSEGDRLWRIRRLEILEHCKRIRDYKSVGQA